MDTLFENSFVRDKQLAKEIYGYYYFQRKWRIVCYVVIILSFLGNVWFAINGNTLSWSVVVFVPLFILLQIYGYFRNVSTMVKRDMEVHGKAITVETVVTDAYIQQTASTGAVNKLEYDSVKKVTRTKNLIMLHSKARLIYIFRKDTFQKGTADEFITFLKGKGIKIK